MAPDRPVSGSPSARREVGLRLQKVLAAAGVGSRRHCEVLIEAGRVAVNGVTVTVQGMRIDPTQDLIEVDGTPIAGNPTLRVLACHKPRGVLSALRDPHGRRCLADLLPADSGRLFHVGRLDVDTTGLIILTNDGTLAQHLAHPSHGVPKTYVARVKGRIPGSAVAALRDGVVLDDGPARADRVRVRDRDGHTTVLEITLHQGRNRIVRRMCEAVGHPVTDLARIAIGSLRLGNLGPGSVRELRPAERSLLLVDLAAVGSTSDRPFGDLGRGALDG